MLSFLALGKYKTCSLSQRLLGEWTAALGSDVFLGVREKAIRWPQRELSSFVTLDGLLKLCGLFSCRRKLHVKVLCLEEKAGKLETDLKVDHSPPDAYLDT
jgi:hypothetical protein